MTVRRVSLDALPAEDLGAVRRDLTDALGVEGLAINHYRVPPGERLPGGLHAHADQEELFVVVDGRATFETYRHGRGLGADGDDPDTDTDTDTDAGAGTSVDAGAGAGVDELTVTAGEVVRFSPGEFQSGRNDADADADRDLVVLALGAPRETADVRLPFCCPDCGYADLRLALDGGSALVCPDCGTERALADCPDCGGNDLAATLGPPDVDDPEPVAVCQDCGGTFDRPPTR